MKRKKSKVKITNPINGNSLIAEVKSNKVKFSNFYNSILSPRIAEDLELNINGNYPLSKITRIENGVNYNYYEHAKMIHAWTSDGIHYDREKIRDHVVDMEFIPFNQDGRTIIPAPRPDDDSAIDLYNIRSVDIRLTFRSHKDYFNKNR